LEQENGYRARKGNRWTLKIDAAVVPIFSPVVLAGAYAFENQFKADLTKAVGERCARPV